MISHSDFEAIAALDLDPIKVKLVHKESGEGWSLQQANAVEAEYRRFLFLMREFPNELAAPRFDVDIFWHYHILDTVKYAQDCEAIFGYFLHHFPYLGLRGEEDLEMHHRAGNRMRELYEDAFGEPYPGAAGESELALDPGATAFSVRAPASAAATDTAFSVRSPASVAAAQTAFSVRAPISAEASPNAFSVRAPVSAARIAFSVRAPTPVGAQQTAFSVRAPASAAATGHVLSPSAALSALTASVKPLATNESAGDEDKASVAAFYSVRPRLDLAGHAAMGVMTPETTAPRPPG